MKIQEVENIIKNGGYICQGDGVAHLYDDRNIFICGIPAATVDRMAQTPGLTRWHESWGGVYVARSNGNKHQQHENTEHCKRIAEDVESWAAGDVRRCPECGNEITRDDWDEIGDNFICPDCHERSDPDDWETLSLWDYFTDDILDIEYRIGSDHNIRSVQIMVAFGGPNIYIDTASCKVELYWWGDRADWPIDREICGEIDDIFSEWFQC